MEEYKEKPWLIDELIDKIDYYLKYAAGFLNELRKIIEYINEENKNE